MHPRVPQSTVVSLLALTLGDERARATWQDALRGLGMPTEDQYPRDQVSSVLSALSAAPGSVGVAARVARVRLETDAAIGDPSPSPGETAVTARPPEPQGATAVTARSAFDRRSGSPGHAFSDAAVDLIPFLAPSLGDEKAREVLQQYAKAMGLLPGGLTRDDANALLESMSQASGLLGVVARLAKARLLLKLSAAR